jgi:tetratricopeptide (TPR) repeat protein
MSALQRPLLLLLVGIICYGALLGPFTAYMKHKPVEEKLGYVPSVNLLRYVCADQKEFVGAALLMKIMMYFGGLMDKQDPNVIAERPDYLGMSNMIHSALKLDPYNMDGYYFAQSFLTWEVKQYAIANKLLDYGMKYRTWDWYLPFFAGFNHAYFLKDFKKAAEYYQRAGELSGEPLYFSLAGRYMQESGQTDLAIVYLSMLEKGEKNQAVKKNYQIRLAAFKEVRRIELARDQYVKTGGALPVTVDALLRSGLLTPPPADPYGGQFFIEANEKVATTSRFSFAAAKNDSRNKAGESGERH